MPFDVGYLTNEFTSRAGVGYGMAPMFDESSPEVDGATMLESLAPDVDFSVEVSGGIERFNVNGNQNAAATLASNNMRPVTDVKKEITTSKAMISETIKQAQSEVLAATKLCGHDPGEVFPDNRMVQNEADMVAQGAVTLASGMPKNAISFTANAVNTGSTVDAVLDDRSKGLSPAQRAKVIAQIQEKLIASSAPTVHDTRTQSSANVVMSTQASAAMKPSKFDWKGFFENGHKLDELMDIDPDNIQPEEIPEYDDLDKLEYKVDEVHENLQVVLNKSEENPELLPPHVQDDIDELAFGAPEEEKEDPEPEIDAADVELVVQALPDLKVPITRDDVDKLSSAELDELKEQAKKLKVLKELNLPDEMKNTMTAMPGVFSA